MYIQHTTKAAMVDRRELAADNEMMGRRTFPVLTPWNNCKKIAEAGPHRVHSMSLPKKRKDNS
jgi:hypothetical protein